MENTKLQAYLFENYSLKSESDFAEFRNMLINSLQKGSYLDLYGSIDKCVLGSIDKYSYQRALKNGLKVAKDFKVEPMEMFFFKDVSDMKSAFYQEFAEKEKMFNNENIAVRPMMYSINEFLNQEY